MADYKSAPTTDIYRKYGVKYNWPTAVKACPEGGHLPANEEGEQLARYVSDHNEKR